MVAIRGWCAGAWRWLVGGLAVACCVGCVARTAPPGAAVGVPHLTEAAFVMADGVLLPYRAWLPPDGQRPWAVVLALHGINDSQDAWELPGPAFAQAGVAVIAPDLRGFGATASRGLWPTTAGMVDDARSMAELVRQRFPGARLFLMGESMGAAALLCLAESANPPQADGWVLLAPAVWGRQQLPAFNRAVLWLTYHTIPGVRFGRPPGVSVRATDNDEALRRLSSDPRTLRSTRVDVVKGLVDLMTDAQAAGSALPGRKMLVVYGARDQLVPKGAMLALWQKLAAVPGVRFGYYADGYHLLYRDLGRRAPIEDTLAWMRDSGAALPSRADQAAASWGGIIFQTVTSPDSAVSLRAR